MAGPLNADTFRVERSIVIDAPAQAIFPDRSKPPSRCDCSPAGFPSSGRTCGFLKRPWRVHAPEPPGAALGDCDEAPRQDRRAALPDCRRCRG